MTRRDLLPIAVITTIVLGAAWFFRDAFTARVSQPDVQGLPLRTKTPNLPPSAHVESAQPYEPGPPSLAIRVTEEFSGGPLEADALVEFADVAGLFVAAVRGQRGKTPILFTGQPYQVLRARVHCREASEAFLGPVVCVPGVTQSFEVKLSRLRMLHVRVPGAREDKVVVSVFSEAPAEFGMTGPLVESAYPIGGACRLRLPPGDYWCVVSSAAVRERFGPAQPPFGLRGPAWGRPVRIAGSDVVLDAKLEDGDRTCAISATVSGATQSAISMSVFACGPGLLRRQVAKVEGEAGSVIQASDLPHGLLEVVAESGGARAASWLRVERGETRSLSLVLEPRHHIMNPFVTGPRVGRVRVTMQSKPAPDVTLVVAARDASEYMPEDVFGKSGPDGVAEAGESMAGDYVLSSIPHSAQPLFVTYTPGADGETVLELWPEGTGAVRFSLAGRPEEFRHVRLQTKHLRQEVMPLHESHGQYDVVGVPPGEQVLAATDSWGVEHTMTVNVEPGQTVKVPHAFPTRRISSEVPGKRLWRDFAHLCAASNDGDERILPRGVYTSSGSRFEMERAPAKAFWLQFHGLDGKLSFAEVPEGREDVINLDWTDLRPGRSDPVATLLVQCRETEKDALSPAVYLSRGRLPWTRIDNRNGFTLGRDNGSGVCGLEARITPGSWRVKVEVRRGRARMITEHEVTAAAGGSATITVDAPPAEERALEPVYAPSALWWTAPEPQPLQPAPISALPTLTLAEAERYSDPRAGCKLQIHVAGASLEELWHATVRHRNSWSVADEPVQAGRDDDSVSLVQVQGRPVLLIPPDLGKRVILHVPGCKPAPIDFPPGARHVAVTLERQ